MLIVFNISTSEHHRQLNNGKLMCTCVDMSTLTRVFRKLEYIPYNSIVLDKEQNNSVRFHVIEVRTDEIDNHHGVYTP